MVSEEEHLTYTNYICHMSRNLTMLTDILYIGDFPIEETNPSQKVFDRCKD
jgi:hypothetical protein